MDWGEKKSVQPQTATTEKPFLDKFLNELPKLPSHYCRQRTSLLYLQPDIISKQQLYKLYKEECHSKHVKPLSIATFSNTLTLNKISLFKPKKDLCETCVGVCVICLCVPIHYTTYHCYILSSGRYISYVRLRLGVTSDCLTGSITSVLNAISKVSICVPTHVTDIRALQYKPSGEIFYKLRFGDEWKLLNQRKTPVEAVPVDNLKNRYDEPQTCRDRWRRIRDNYRRAKKLRKTKSGQAATNMKKPKYEDLLSFLIPYISNEDETLSNFPPNNVSQDSSNEDNSLLDDIHSRDSSGSSADIPPQLSPTHSLLQEYLEKKYGAQKNKSDKIVEFFKTVSNFPEDVQISVKREVFKIVTDAEELVFREKPQCVLEISQESAPSIIVVNSNDVDAQPSNQIITPTSTNFTYVDLGDARELLTLEDVTKSLGQAEYIALATDAWTSASHQQSPRKQFRKTKIDDIAQKLDHLITTANANEINVQVLFDRQQNVNRGFRDSLPLLRSCGYNVHIPLSPEDNEPQLTTSQANKSRAVTLCRWVVEVVNGIFKSKASKHLMMDFSVAAALINKYHTKLRDRDDAHEIIQIVNRNMNINNDLSDYVRVHNLNRARADFHNINVDRENIRVFPRLHYSELILIACGIYQLLKQARSYYGEHIRFNGSYIIEVSRDPRNRTMEEVIFGSNCYLIRAKIA
ncbi:hypothetical protein SFRURICE_012188, partial [Spodoptera frugiperda]